MISVRRALLAAVAGASLSLAGAGSALAAAGDLIVVNDAPTPSIISVNPVTMAQTTIASGGNFVDPRGIAMDSSGMLYVADRSAYGGGGGIVKVNPATGAQTTLSSGGSFVDPYGIAFAPDGDLLVTDLSAFGGGGALFRVDPTTGAQAKISSGSNFSQPTAVTVSSNGDYYVADQNAFGGSGGILKVDSATGAQTTFANGGNFSDPVGIVQVYTGDFAVTDFSAYGGNGGVVRVSLGGVQSTFASGSNFVDPFGLAVGPAGYLYVSDSNAYGGNGGIVAVNLPTGGQTTVATDGNFVDPFGIVVVPGQNPIASFTDTPNPAVTGQTVTFDASASRDLDGSIARYEWDLDGDGVFETDSGTNPVVTRSYTSGGTIVVALRVTDNSGQTGRLTDTLTISGRDVQRPVIGVRFGSSVRSLGSLISRGLSVQVRSNEAARARVGLLRGELIVGRGSSTVSAGTSKSVRVRLTAKGRRALRRRARTGLVLRVAVTDHGGNTTVRRRSLTVRR